MAFADYVAFLYYVEHNASSTIGGKLTAVRWLHAVNCIEVPPVKYVADVIKAVARGSRPPASKRGLFLADIMAGRAAAAAEGPTSLATWRGILLSYFYLLRASEIWAYPCGRVHAAYCARVGSLRLYRDAGRLPLLRCREATEVRLIIKGSKTDQLQTGATLVLFATDGGPEDPVQLVCDILLSLPADATLDYPLMTVRDQRRSGGLRAITRDEAAAFIKRLAVARGYDADRYSTHSMRAGGATALAVKGVEPRLIKLAGRWKSDAFLGYIRGNTADYARISSALSTGSAVVAVY